METTAWTWNEALQQNGFVVVENVVPPSLLTRLRNCVNGIQKGYAKLERRLKSRTYFRNFGEALPEKTEPLQQVSFISDIAMFGWPFRELICCPVLLEVLETLFDTPEFVFRYASCRVRHADEKAGDFHREATPYAQTDPRGLVCILPLEEMSAENGGTRFIKNSHLLTDEEAMTCAVAERLLEKWPASTIVTPAVPAGAGLFFNYKIIHSTGSMREQSPPRRTVLTVWESEHTLSTRAARFAYDGLRPRSKLPQYQQQMRMTFPSLFAKSSGTL
jgi:ectoine hydroxylase-related dioxygenase (phytanoyl-CoA dioxygenase family)